MRRILYDTLKNKKLDGGTQDKCYNPKPVLYNEQNVLFLIIIINFLLDLGSLTLLVLVL